MKKSVNITFKNPMSVVVEGATEKELLINAQNAIIEELKKKFPAYMYSINDCEALTFQTAYPGTIVETNEGDLGIITAINKKTINVTLTGHRDVNGPPMAFKYSNATFEEARSKRKVITMNNTGDGTSSSFKGSWEEGDTGYLVTAKKVEPVVVGKKTGSKYKVFPINGKGEYYTITEAQIQAFLKEEQSEA